MANYSHSKLSCFEQCPLKFKFAYIDNVETEFEETVEGFLGSRVHEALEKLYKDLKFEKLNTLPELLDFFNKQWDENWNENIVVNRYEASNYKKMGVKFISDYYKHYSPFSQSVTIGLETQNTVALDDKYHIHVRIDRLAVNGGVYEIHDYKTSSSLPSQEKLDNDRQLALYAYGIKKMYPDAEEVKLVWHFLAFDKEMCSSRRPEHLEQLRKEVLKLIGQIESESEFKPCVSALCDWCEFQTICPEWRHKFETEHLETKDFLKEDGVKLVNEFASVKNEADKINEKLEVLRTALVDYAHANKLNAVFGSDVKASIRSYPKLSFPKKGDKAQKDFFKAVKEIGLWEKLSTVDVYELAKMINSGQIDEELMKLLGRFITRGEATIVRVGRK